MRHLICFGGLGFFMGFRSTVDARKLGIKVESNRRNAIELLPTTILGAAATLFWSKGDTYPLCPYFSGLVIGILAGIFIFDKVNPDYKYQAPTRR